jgi:enterochelin esterase-like enzyme
MLREFGAWHPDLIPFVQATYRVAADCDRRARAGLSMGGGQTVNIGPRHLDLFSRLAVFSASAGNDPAATLQSLFKTMPGVHTWILWRHFLNEVAPQL